MHYGDYPIWRGKWRDRRGRWRDRRGRYCRAPQAPPSEWPTKRKQAPTTRERTQSKRRATAAKRRWEREHKEALARSRRAKRGWRTRRFHRARERLVGGLHGKRRNDWISLRNMIRDKHPRWLEFLKICAEQKIGSKRMRDGWMSPKWL